MPYLNCPVCHLSLRVGAHFSPEYCPRCIGRRRGATPLFLSPLPMRELVDAEKKERVVGDESH